MAKTTKVERPEDEAPQAEALSQESETGYESRDEKIEYLESEVQRLSTILEGHEASILAVASGVQEKMNEFDQVVAKLDEEQTQRRKLMLSEVANLPRKELSQLLIQAVVQHHLATEGNTFEIVRTTPAVMRDAGRRIVDYFEQLVTAIEQAVKERI